MERVLLLTWYEISVLLVRSRQDRMSQVMWTMRARLLIVSYEKHEVVMRRKDKYTVSNPPRARRLPPKVEKVSAKRRLRYTKSPCHHLKKKPESPTYNNWGSPFNDQDYWLPNKLPRHTTQEESIRVRRNRHHDRCWSYAKVSRFHKCVRRSPSL